MGYAVFSYSSRLTSCNVALSLVTQLVSLLVLMKQANYTINISKLIELLKRK